MYAGRSVFWIQPFQDDQKICAISRHTLRLDPSIMETTATLRYEISCVRCPFSTLLSAIFTKFLTSVFHKHFNIVCLHANA